MAYIHSTPQPMNEMSMDVWCTHAVRDRFFAPAYLSCSVPVCRPSGVHAHAFCPCMLSHKLSHKSTSIPHHVTIVSTCSLPCSTCTFVCYCWSAGHIQAFSISSCMHAFTRGTLNDGLITRSCGCMAVYTHTHRHTHSQTHTIAANVCLLCLPRTCSLLLLMLLMI